jgi:hypothetical protein
MAVVEDVVKGLEDDHVRDKLIVVQLPQKLCQHELLLVVITANVRRCLTDGNTSSHCGIEDHLRIPSFTGLEAAVNLFEDAVYKLHHKPVPPLVDSRHHVHHHVDVIKATLDYLTARDATPGGGGSKWVMPFGHPRSPTHRQWAATRNLSQECTTRSTYLEDGFQHPSLDRRFGVAPGQASEDSQYRLDSILLQPLEPVGAQGYKGGVRLLTRPQTRIHDICFVRNLRGLTIGNECTAGVVSAGPWLSPHAREGSRHSRRFQSESRWLDPDGGPADEDIT